MVRAAFALCQQGIVQTWTGDYLAAVTSDEQALPLAHGSGDQHAEACALQFLADAQRLTGDHLAAASYQEALDLFRDLGQAEVLNRLGELSTRTSVTSQARDLPAHRRPRRPARPGKSRTAQTAFHHPRGPGQSALQQGPPTGRVCRCTQRSRLGTSPQLTVAEQPDLRRQQPAGTKQSERAY